MRFICNEARPKIIFVLTNAMLSISFIKNFFIHTAEKHTDTVKCIDKFGLKVNFF